MSDPFAPAADAGIHRLAIPTPFAVGRVNVYLIEDEPLTLVDSGPNSGTSFDELQRGLAALGHELADIGLIIITHQHIDHLGLVSIVASHSSADVAAIDAAVPFVENYPDEAAADDEFALGLMLRHGIPEDVATALHSVSLGEWPGRKWTSNARSRSSIRSPSRSTRVTLARAPQARKVRDTDCSAVATSSGIPWRSMSPSANSSSAAASSG